MVEIVGHSQTKGRDNREPKLRPKPARQSSTLPMSGMWKWSHKGTAIRKRRQEICSAYIHRATSRLYQ